ncbi:MAG: hypothetical protein O7C75_18095, partial [Verrucomicrobia bacterium]|nr:hypothetical protein [Verrucomicrobiota bacterium]
SSVVMTYPWLRSIHLPSILFSIACTLSVGIQSTAKIDWQPPAQGGKSFGVARLTNDSTVRDWGNYHNAQNWSYNGRYLAYTRYGADGERFGRAPEVHLIDLQTGNDRRLDGGSSPRWANQHNWLFFTKEVRGSAKDRLFEVWWYNIEADKKILMGTGMSGLGGVSMDDQWLLGGLGLSDGSVARSHTKRMRIQENSVAEYLPGLDAGSQWIPNPVYNVAFSRVPNRDDEPFYPTRYWYDIDGGNIQVGSVTLTRCHQSWTGDGQYYLLGNSQVRGRLWNQPFPSSLHFLAAVGTGDVSPCGRNGRFVVGDKPLTIADLRSGDGWVFLEDLSIICYPDNVSDDSGPYDSDMKGSPDGTKVNFVTNYDLIDGPVTRITKSAGLAADRVEVESTAMFPDSGTLVVNREVLGYKSKTPTSFDGLTRTLYHTLASNLREDNPVTSFEARSIPENEWKKLPLPLSSIERSMGGLDSPLVRQKSTDVWAAVVRLPDRPWLRLTDEGVQLIPGESHYETSGYKLFSNGRRVTSELLRPGETLSLKSGQYTAVAMEWSGLESNASNPLEISNPASLRIMHEKPADFSWTFDEWSIDGKSVERERAFASAGVVREIRHRYDGVIARESFSWGEIQSRHDLNESGLSIRRLVYHEGALFKREYHNRDGLHLSTEYLDTAGNVTEMIRYHYVDDEGGAEADLFRYATGPAEGKQVEYDHWWYQNGMPLRRIGMAPARRIESKTPVMYVKAGEEWVLQNYVGKLPQKNKLVESFSHDRQRAEEFIKRSTIQK